jgi:hypothetical protein
MNVSYGLAKAALRAVVSTSRIGEARNAHAEEQAKPEYTNESHGLSLRHHSITLNDKKIFWSLYAHPIEGGF